jgi:hypothetical protein
MYVQARLLRPRAITWLVVLLSLGVSFRLTKLSQPFIDAWSWRQSDVAMIAENFYRHGFRLFYPQINWAGNGPGYVGTEFQLVPFLASLFYICFGVYDWIGRAVSVLFFREYIRASRGEFTVAKDQNIRLRSGWFSDRSACYLAAGRPVITQDTGFGNIIPTGAGLFAFTTEDEALAAIATVAHDYERQSLAARRIAQEYFAAERVLGDVLRRIGLL